MTLQLIERGCPNCGGVISSDRLEKALPCSKCLPKPEEEVCNALTELENLKYLKPFCDTEEKLEEFTLFFEKAVGAKPWSLQRVWAKRVFMNQSFAIVAPTGVGKTTFGLVMSLFLKGRVLMIFPTRLLANQAGDKLLEISDKLGLQRKILVYQSKKKIKAQFLKGDWSILIGTNMFLHKNFENLMNFKFKLIFIDDIDSFLKKGKNIDNLFKLLGFTEEGIRLAIKEEKSQRDYDRLARIRKRKKDTVLIVSSATLKPKGKRAHLFRNLLGFDVQKAITTLRNIADVAEPVLNLEEALEKSAELIRKLGKGGLVFLSVFYGKEKIEEIKEYYKSKGIDAVSYLDYKPEKLYQILEKGDFDVALGISHITNPLVRGIDLPHIIRYVVFLDPPKHVFPTQISLNPSLLYSLLLTLLSLFEEEDRLKAVQHITYLKRYLTLREEQLDNYPKIKEKVEEIKEFLEKFLRDEGFLKRIQRSDDISLVPKDGKLYIVIGDANSYIQASGRTSRFVAGGMTKGLSVVFYSDPKAFYSLKKRLTLYYMTQDIEFKRLEEIDLEKLIKEIDQDRKRAKAILEGKGVVQIKDLFKTTLVIVESPNKARTIASFFGKPQMRLIEDSVAYEVPLGDRLLIITASLGHILDLITYKGFFGVIDDTYPYLPIYDTIKICRETHEQHTDYKYLKNRCKGKIEDKMEIIKGIRRVGYEVDEVFIATDPDAEGEKIGYDLYLLLKPFNKNVGRVEFHEVTPKAFKEAIEKPRKVDLNLVKAQLVRRILDRWVGFTLSHILWDTFGKKWLSAGRVQTPVLGWIIERYDKSKEKKGEIFLLINEYPLKMEIEDLRFAKEVFKDLDIADIYLIKPEEEEKKPMPPYTTDTILEDANEKLRIGAKKTMKILQELFEGGYITYHRTDSTRVSDAGKYLVAKPYITKKFGEEFFYPRSWAEGGAHECIRPTRPLEPKDLEFMITAGIVDFEDRENTVKLYELIFKRFMASQMRPVKVLTQELTVRLPYYEFKERVITQIKEHGFDLIYPYFKIFPETEKLEISGKEFREIPKVYPYTQGTLIQEMKKRGLGRPSTYAQIVQTLMDRHYVVEEKGFLIPTDLGRKVYTFLVENFPDWTSEELTRQLEEAMDKIESGEIDYMKVLKEVHRIKNLLKEQERVRRNKEEIRRA